LRECRLICLRRFRGVFDIELCAESTGMRAWDSEGLYPNWSDDAGNKVNEACAKLMIFFLVSGAVQFVPVVLPFSWLLACS
jgi:hypothetical protein